MKKSVYAPMGPLKGRTHASTLAAAAGARARSWLRADLAAHPSVVVLVGHDRSAPEPGTTFTDAGHDSCH